MTDTNPKNMSSSEAAPEGKSPSGPISSNREEMYARFNADGRLTHANAAYARQFGQSRNELLGMSIYARLSPREAEYVREALEGLTPENRMVSTETRVRRKDGTWGWQFWTNRAIFDEAGKLLGYEMVGRDVSALHDAETSLHRHKALLEAIFEAAGTGLIILDEDGHIVRANQAFSDLAGRSLHELTGLHFEALIPAEMVEPALESLRKVVTQGAIPPLEHPLVTRDGRTRWLSITTGATDSADGRRLAVISAVDITEAREASRALANRVRRQEIVLEFGRLALSDLPLGGLLEKAAAMISAGLEAEYVSIMERSEDGARLTLRAGTREPGQEGEEASGDSLARIALEAGEPVIGPDPDLGLRLSTPPFPGGLQAESAVCVAAPGGEAPFGVICAGAAGTRRFNRDEAHFLQTMANTISSAVENRRTSEALREARDELESRVDQRTGQLRQANEELRDEMEQRERITEALAATEERYRMLFNSSRDLIFVHWRAHDIFLGEPLEVNDVARRVLGYSKDELLMSTTRLIDRKDEAVVTQALEKLEKDGHALFEVDLLTKDGRVIPMEFNSRQFQLNNLPTVLSVARDITIRRLAEKELKRAKSAADEASRAKSEFLANMSHEIRTPMNGIIGMTDLALETPLNDEQRDYLALVKSSAETLMALLNDILDFSKIEAGRLDLIRDPFSLRKTLGSVVGALSLHNRLDRVEVVLRVDPDVPDWLLGDPVRLQQVAFNLVGNALKFTRQGEVVFRVKRTAGGLAPSDLHFTVMDTGIGIESRYQERIFDAFIQADASISRQFQGTGLGLAISSNLVKLMGGRIWVESEVGRGSEFHFTIPFDPAEGSGGVTGPDVPDWKGWSALIVADNAHVRETVADLLSAWGLAPVKAADVDQAMAGGLDLDPSKLLILSEVRQENGKDLASVEALRAALAGAGAPLVVLAPSAHGEVRARTRAVGRAVYVAKPVQEDDLSAALDALYQNDTDGGDDEAAPQGVPDYRVGEGRRILLAEDNPINQMVVIRFLEKRGFEVHSVANGLDVLNHLKEKPWDLILMDVQMPDLDGIQTTRAIRSREGSTGRRLPIVAMTAHAMKGDRERFLEAGMDDYLSKPVKTDEMLETILKLLNNEGNAPEPAGAPVWNRESAMARLDNDESLLSEMLDLFFLDLRGKIERIEAAMNEGDAQGLESEAHSIKGAAANLSAERLAETALELETAGRSGKLEKAGQIFKNLKNELETFRLQMIHLGLHREEKGREGD